MGKTYRGKSRKKSIKTGEQWKATRKQKSQWLREASKKEVK